MKPASPWCSPACATSGTEREIREETRCYRESRHGQFALSQRRHGRDRPVDRGRLPLAPRAEPLGDGVAVDRKYIGREVALGARKVREGPVERHAVEAVTQHQPFARLDDAAEAEQL